MTSLIRWQHYSHVKYITASFAIELVAAKPGLSPTVEYKWRGSDEMAGIRRCLTCAARCADRHSSVGKLCTVLYKGTHLHSSLVKPRLTGIHFVWARAEIGEILKLQT